MRRLTCARDGRDSTPGGAVVLLLVWLAAGCQTQQPPLPAPTVRPVQWHYQPSRISTFNAPHTSARWVEPGDVPAYWIPPRSLEDRNRWEGIIVHHSADDYGDAQRFHEVHKKRGWDGLGYHFVVNNGNNHNGMGDGAVEVGYRWKKQATGAHCRVDPQDNNYWNEHTIGICLVGNFEKHRPSEAQWRSLVKLCRFLQGRYPITTEKIIGHRDVKATKCPGKYLQLRDLRRRLEN